MTYEVAVAVEYEADPPLDVALFTALAERTLTMEGAPAGSVSVVLTDDATVQSLNREYRGLDEPTDVLSFGLSGLARSLDEEPAAPFVTPAGALLEIGEVIVAVPYAARQAEQRGRDVRDELALLVVHGVLHLLGHDHAEPEEEAAMQAREREVLAAFGIER
jgi:probable rRNA maturation factor